jgi:chorismate mutase
MGETLWVRAVRGAAPVPGNTPRSILYATRKLLTAISDRNSLQPENIISVILSLTPDLNAAFPAEAARELGWLNVPLFCTTEIPVPGALKMCVRVLVHAYLPCKQDEVKHIYLEEAAALRPDIHGQKNG